MTRIIGVDEAGKGPVIGPMIIAGVVFECSEDYSEKPFELKGLEVKDSKKLVKEERKLLSTKIKEKCIEHRTFALKAPHIDNLRQRKNMNQIMVDFFIEVLKQINFDIAILDAADVDKKRFGQKIKKRLKTKKKVISEHKADEKYPIVSAASILAKTRRDKEIKRYEERIGTEIGNGYPSDNKTREFIKKWVSENKELPVFCRKTWKTSKNILKEIKQSRLEEFSCL